MAGRLHSQAFVALIAPLYARLQQEWENERPEVNDGAELLRKLGAAKLIAPDDLAQMRSAIEAALVEEVKTGY